jgi:hypothetical protein
MKKLLVLLLFCTGCVHVSYVKEDYTQINGKIYLTGKEKVEYKSNDENLNTVGLSLNLSKSNGSKLDIGNRTDKGDPNLIRAYGLAGKDVIGSFNGSNAIESVLGGSK